MSHASVDLVFWGVLLAALLLAAGALGWRRRGSVAARRHVRYQAGARRALQVLRHIGPRQNPGRMFGYLRKVGPLIFEEMILTELEDRGYEIRRSKRYSGDGGVDGGFFLDGQRYLIQAKRYAKHVNPQHVGHFIRLCERRNVAGLFVHTGRTGRASWEREGGSRHVRIISGDDLVKFFGGEPIRLGRSR